MDIFYKLLLGAAAIFALYWMFKSKKIIPALISLGMIVAIVMVVFPSLALLGPGLYVYMVFILLAFVYGLAIKGKKPGERIVISFMTLPVLIYWLWALNHWHGNVVWAPAFVIITALIALVSKAKLKDEAGFLVILTVDAIAILLEILVN